MQGDDIFQFIEVFYNRHRRHSSVRYLSPAQFEKEPVTKARKLNISQGDPSYTRDGRGETGARRSGGDPTPNEFLRAAEQKEIVEAGSALVNMKTVAVPERICFFHLTKEDLDMRQGLFFSRSY